MTTVNLLATTLNLNTRITLIGNVYYGVVEDNVLRVDSKKVLSILNKSLRYLSISNSFCDFFNNDCGNVSSKLTRLEDIRSSNIYDPVVYISIVIFNNVYNMTKSQKSNLEGILDERVNVSTIYAEVFKGLRINKDMTLDELSKYNKTKLIEVSNQEVVLRNDVASKLDVFESILINNLNAAINKLKNAKNFSFFYGSQKDLNTNLMNYIKREMEWCQIECKVKHIINEIINPNLNFILASKSRKISELLDNCIQDSKSLNHKNRSLICKKRDTINAEIENMCHKYETNSTQDGFAVCWKELLNIEKKLIHLKRVCIA